jgi:uncharacterized protein (DUF488 family)
MSEIVWTIGTGHRSLAEFLEVLSTQRITALLDVRSFPRSHLDHFNREALESELPGRGIGYHWLGNDLGGLRPGGYERHTATDRYARGLAQLERLARAHRVAVCCAELNPDRCHRRFIADSLAERGWRIVHLIDTDARREHALLPRQVELPLREE